MKTITLIKQTFTGNIRDVIARLERLSHEHGHDAEIKSLPVSKKGGFELVER